MKTARAPANCAAAADDGGGGNRRRGLNFDGILVVSCDSLMEKGR